MERKLASRFEIGQPFDDRADERASVRPGLELCRRPLVIHPRTPGYGRTKAAGFFSISSA